MTKALIVDDSKLIRDIEKSVFAQIGGVETDEAADGAEAMDKLTNNKYDILILDWMMPKMTGEQVLREIRGVPGPNKDIPTIMVTAEVKRHKILALAALKIHGYVTKPFTAELLEEKIKGVLGKKKLKLE